MIQRRITFTNSCSDGAYCRICEQAELDGVFVKCLSYTHKVLWVQFQTPEEEQAWMEKINTNKLQ